MRMKILIAFACPTPCRRASSDESQVCYDTVQTNLRAGQSNGLHTQGNS